MGKGTRLCFAGHVLMENRHGLAVDVELTQATGTSEREAAMTMLRRTRTRRRRCTLGADKGLRHPGVRGPMQRDGRGSPHRHARELVGQRAPGTAEGNLRLPSEPAAPQAGGRDLRLGQDGWRGRKLRYLGVERNRL